MLYTFIAQQRKLDKNNRKLRKMKNGMEQQLKVVDTLEKTWGETALWTGLAFMTIFISKAFEHPHDTRRSTAKREASMKFEKLQMKAASLYYYLVNREGYSREQLIKFPDVGQVKLLLAEEDWRTQKSELLNKYG